MEFHLSSIRFTCVKTKGELEVKQNIYPITILNSTMVRNGEEGGKGYTISLIAMSYKEAIAMIKKRMFDDFDDLIEELTRPYEKERV